MKLILSSVSWLTGILSSPSFKLRSLSALNALLPLTLLVTWNQREKKFKKEKRNPTKLSKYLFTECKEF